MRKKGFTLLELLMVISIMGILLSVAVLRFDFFTKLSEEAEVRTVVSQMRYCRNKAISTGLETRIKLQQGTDHKLVTLISFGGNHEEKSYSYLKRLSSKGEIKFSRSGAPVSETSTFTFIFQGRVKNYEIVVRPASGYIYWKK